VGLSEKKIVETFERLWFQLLTTRKVTDTSKKSLLLRKINKYSITRDTERQRERKKEESRV
jgi:hypothetical protein